MLVLEHNLDLVAHADWLIDLGPEAGTEGGRVLYEGTPAGLVRARESVSHTGEYLRCAVGDAAADGALTVGGQEVRGR